jgi:hypothetical protein
MLRGNNINSEAVIKRLIAEMYQIQADIDEDNERIGDRFDRNESYRYISDEELGKLKEIYRKNELISDTIDAEIDALDDILDKIKKEKDKK